MMDFILGTIGTLFVLSINIFEYKQITKEKLKISISNVSMIILSAVLIIFLSYTQEYLLKVLALLILTNILIINFYKEDVLKTFYYTFFIWIFLIFSDIALSVIIMLNKLSFYDISSNIIFRTFLTIPVSFLQFLLILFSKSILIKIYDRYYKKITNNTIFIFLLSFFIMSLSFLSCLSLYKSQKNVESYIIIVFIVILLLIIVYLIKYIIKSYNLSSLNKNIINENKLIREMSKNDAIFKHNLINNLLGIEVVANKKAKLLIDELIIKYRNDYEKISNINELPSGIQGLIYKKIYLKNISDLNFRVENGFEGDIEKLMTSKNYNLLSETIGILLDNALEAVENCNNKIVVIDMEKTDDNIFFEIKNSFDTQLDFEDLGSAKYTTKKNGHGIGMNYLLENKNVELKSSIVNNLFQVKAIIKIKK